MKRQYQEQNEQLRMTSLPLLQNDRQENGSIPHQNHRKWTSSKRTRTLLLIPALALITFTTFHDVLQDLQAKISRTLCAKTPYISIPDAQSMTVITPYDGVEDERAPSHIEMCRSFLARKDSPEQFMEKTIIMEDDDVCRNWDAPHYFLMRIFASSLVGMVSSSDNLEYRHNCQYTRVTGLDDGRSNYNFDTTTVQQILAQADLLFDSGGEGLPTVTKEVVGSLCRGCLVHYDASKRPRPDANMYSRMTHECLLYPGVDTLDALKTAVQLSDDEATSSMIPLNAMLPIITKVLRHAALDWSHKTVDSGSVTPQKEHESGVVIYIDESSTMMSAPIFAKYVNTGATSISVLASPACARTPNAVCYKEATKLAAFLDNFFPAAVVSVNVVASTATAYSRMIRAKDLLCHPGSVSCLFPALVKDEKTYAIVGVSPLRKGTYGWFDQLKTEESRTEVVKLQAEETVLNFDIDYDDSTGVTGNRFKFNNFGHYNPLNSLPTLGSNEYGTWAGSNGQVVTGHHITGGAFGTRKDCTQIRGKMGSWDRNDYDLDWDYDALVENGGTPDLHGKASLGMDSLVGSRVSSFNAGSAASGKYAWNEDAFQDCKFDMLNLDGLCDIVHKMDLSRIFFVGDKLQSDMVSSFWNLLQENQRDYMIESMMQNDPNDVWSRTLNCLKHGKHFDLAFTRNDRLSPMSSSGMFPPNMGYAPSGIQCNPWENYYASSPGRTLVVASPGTTAYDGERRMDAFQSDFDGFTKTLQSFSNRPDDIVLVRTAAPTFGHCDLPITESDMVQFNAYASRAVSDYERERRQYQKQHPPIHLLDVAPMTFAHPHGRYQQEMGGGSCMESKEASSNLLDWWNHMLYNHLIDMSMMEHDG